MRMLVLGAAVVVVTLGLGGPASAGLVVNGDFETGDFTGWTLSGNSGFISVGTGRQHGGTYSARFGAVGSPTFLTQSQDLATTAGQGYELTFWLANEGGTPNSFTASVGGVTAFSLTDASPFSYTKYTYDFTATASTTSLQFGFQQNPSFWDFDDVDVVPTTTAVPEPATLAGACLAALTALGYGWRRRKRS